MLTQERLLEILSFDPDTGVFIWKDRPESTFARPQACAAWRAKCLGQEAGADTGHGYRRIFIDGRSYLSHRLAWLYFYGSWPSKQIDHINGNGCDNRIDNLRDVSNAENRKNCKRFKTNTSGITGVRFDERYGTWRAAIWRDAKIVHLGSFPTKHLAAEARQQAERRFGYHPNHGRSPSQQEAE